MPTVTNIQILVEEAGRHCASQNCAEAIRLLEQAVCLQPATPRLYYQLGYCYHGGCRCHSLVCLEMAERYLRHGLALADSFAGSPLRAEILDTLASTILIHTSPSPTRTREALAYLSEAAACYARNGQPDEWAPEEFNQGNGWCDLPGTEFPEKWNEAIRHYENALQVRTRQHDPLRYALTILNLGTAFRQLPQGSRAANVLKAVSCYRSALRVYTLADAPHRFANVYNNLGNAALDFPAGGAAARVRHARSALRYFGRALAIWTAECDPYHHALVQYNRAVAFLRLPPSPENLASACACLRDACASGTACGRPGFVGLVRSQARLWHLRCAGTPESGELSVT